MREISITEKEEGQRLDKILGKYLNQAPSSFLYKMLRKKNIKLNQKKADGKEKVRAGDVITLYLADETIEKFQNQALSNMGQIQKEKKKAGQEKNIGEPEVIFENEHILLLNKPAGLLSQKAAADDISLNEQILVYCLKKGLVTEEELKIRKPSVANRLDRNTTGLIVAGISIKGLTFLSELFRNRTLEKYYYTIVRGELKKPLSLKGYLKKDEKKNQVTVTDKKMNSADSYIETQYEPLRIANGYTLLKVKLVTGKPHQIRAHLSHIGHPVLGDGKYGDPALNRYWKKEAGLNYQLLHSAVFIFPKLTGEWEEMSLRRFEAKKPLLFEQIEKKIFGMGRN